MNNEIIEGKLVFHSQTGTEGGYWAFQDSNYISLVSPVFGVVDGVKVRDINDHTKCGLTSDTEIYLNNEWLPWIDPIIKEADYRISSLFCGEERGDLSADKRLMDKYNFKIKYAAQQLNEMYGVNNWRIEGGLSKIILNDGTLLSFGCTPDTEPTRPYVIPQNGITRVTINWDNGEIEYQRKSDTLLVEQWSYKGLHVLKNGDKLKILHPLEKTIVWDSVIELKPYYPFNEHVDGWWIHADQKGISREEWSKFFFDGFLAILQTYNNEEE